MLLICLLRISTSWYLLIYKSTNVQYVRPGAAPIPGAAPPATGGAPGQVRPPATMPPFAVRGPGDWRPGTMQKNFHSGQGIPGWGTGAPRGLDFTLPSHK